MCEERGIPGIAVITDPFKPTATAMATTWGLPGFRFASTPHPIATLKGPDLDERAARLTEMVLELLRG